MSLCIFINFLSKFEPHPVRQEGEPNIAKVRDKTCDDEIKVGCVGSWSGHVSRKLSIYSLLLDFTILNDYKMRKLIARFGNIKTIFMKK